MMRREASLVLALLVAAWAAGASAAGAVKKFETIRHLGVEHINLTNWAAANGLETRWLKREKELELTNRWSRWRFTVDSRRMEFNGAGVWLSFPLALRGGSPLVSVLDIETTLQPLRDPARGRASDRVRVVCLDAGHGGNDPGYKSGAHTEKEHTLLLTMALQEVLREAGLKTILTRAGDKPVDLEARTALARRSGADLFVSLHFNAASNSSAHGVEVYCLTPAGATSTNTRPEGTAPGALPGNAQDDKNILLAYHIQKAMVTALGAEDRGVRRARFAVLRTAEMPAVLVEGGFLSHPQEAVKIASPTYRRQMAKAIAEGILTYKRIVER